MIEELLFRHGKDKWQSARFSDLQRDEYEIRYFPDVFNFLSLSLSLAQLLKNHAPLKSSALIFLVQECRGVSLAFLLFCVWPIIGPTLP